MRAIPLTPDADNPKPSRHLNRWDGSLKEFRVPYPGLSGVLDHAVQMVTKWTGDIQLRNIALKAVGDRDKRNNRKLATALYDWITGRVRFVRDPFGIERIQSPDVTLQMGTGDCDDQAILSAAILRSLGIPARFRVVALDPNNPDTFNHIYTEFFDGNEWKSFDTTLETFAGFPIDESKIVNSKRVKIGNNVGAVGSPVLKKKSTKLVERWDLKKHHNYNRFLKMILLQSLDCRVVMIS